MRTIRFIVIIYAVVMLLLAFVPGRALWGMTDGWKYRDPEANMPSNAALILKKVRFGLIGLAVGGAAVWLTHLEMADA